MLSWTGGPGSTAAFAATALFYVPALVMIALPNGLPLIGRALTGLAAVPWAAFGTLYLTNPAASGDAWVSTALKPLQIAGYLVLTAAVISWIVVTIRQPD
jgi:hypothetical protein